MGDKDQDKDTNKSIGDTIKEAFLESALPAAQIVLGLSNPSLGANMMMRNVGFNHGIRDLVRDVPWAITWFIADGAGGNLFWGSDSGDQQWAPHVAQAVEDFWKNYVDRQYQLGGQGEDFRMAAGWQLPKDAKYNGKSVDSLKDKDGNPTREISDVTAIFYKNNKGQIEVLTYTNPEYQRIVGPYLFAQIGAMVATGGAGTVLKGMPVGARTISVASKVGVGLEVLDQVTSVSQLADGFAQPLIFKPMALDTLGDMFANPNSMDVNTIKKSLNTFMSQYSHQIGTMTEQYYIPSLKDGDDVWKQLERVGTSRLEGFRRHDPFQDIRGWERKEPYFGVIENTNIRSGLQDHAPFNKAYYELAQKALKGGLGEKPEGMSEQEYQKIHLSDKEVTALRFMLDIKAGADLDMKEAGYTPKERSRTFDVLVYKINQERAADPKYNKIESMLEKDLSKASLNQFANYAFQAGPGEDKAANAPKIAEYTAEQRLSFVEDKRNEWQGKVNNENAEALRRSQSAEASMMAMH